MKHRAAIILSGAFGLGACTDGSRRFGSQRLLERVVEVARAVAGQVAVIPAAEPFSEKYAAGPLAGVAVGAPPEPPGVLLPAVAQGLALAGGGAEAVALIPGGLPYLTAAWLEGLFGALGPGGEAVCAVEGERPLFLPAVYAGAALARMAGNGKGEGLWPAEGGGVPGFPAAPAGPPGKTVASFIETDEDYREALAALGFCQAGHAEVTVEVFGNLRIRTGLHHLPIYADSVGRACEVLRRVYPETERLLPLEGAMAEHFRFSINGETVTTDLARPLRRGDHLILFSASVGG